MTLPHDRADSCAVLLHRPCDDLAELHTRLMAHAENMGQNSASAPGARSEPPQTVADASDPARHSARECQIRLRLGDGSQVSLSHQHLCACVHFRLRRSRWCSGWCCRFGLLDIGSEFAEQVTQSLQSDASLQVLFDLVTERQGGDSGFTFIVPGPPGAVLVFLADGVFIKCAKIPFFDL